MKYYIRNGCKCGGWVNIITNLELNEKTNKKEIIVSHGVCIYCNDNVVYPNEELNVFLSWFDKSDIVKR